MRAQGDLYGEELQASNSLAITVGHHISYGMTDKNYKSSSNDESNNDDDDDHHHGGESLPRRPDN